MEGLENYLVRSLERDLSKSYNKPLQKLLLIPKPVPPHIKYDIGRFARGIFAFFAAVVLLAFLTMTLYLVSIIFDTFTLQKIQRHWRTMLHVAFIATKGPLFILCLIPFVSTLLFTAIQYPSLWAWNRRAKRLNREATLPQRSPADTLGVWPPPPTVSASADTTPRI